MRLHSKNRKRKYDEMFNSGANNTILSQSLEPGSQSALKHLKTNEASGIMGTVDLPSTDQYNKSGQSMSQQGYDN